MALQAEALEIHLLHHQVRVATEETQLVLQPLVMAVVEAVGHLLLALTEQQPPEVMAVTEPRHLFLGHQLLTPVAVAVLEIRLLAPQGPVVLVVEEMEATLLLVLAEQPTQVVVEEAVEMAPIMEQVELVVPA